MSLEDELKLQTEAMEAYRQMAADAFCIRDARTEERNQLRNVLLKLFTHEQRFMRDGRDSDWQPQDEADVRIALKKFGAVLPPDIAIPAACVAELIPGVDFAETLRAIRRTITAVLPEGEE